MEILIIPNKYLPLHAEIEPKTQTCVERCKVVKTLFKGLTLLQRFNLLKDSAIQTDFRLLVAPPKSFSILENP